MCAYRKNSGALVHLYQHDGKCIWLYKILSLFAVTAVRRVCLVQQLEFSISEGSGMHVGVHGNFTVGV